PGASAARAADTPFTSEGRVAVASKNGDASSRLSLPRGAPGGQSVPLFPHNHLRLHRMESFFFSLGSEFGSGCDHRRQMRGASGNSPLRNPNAPAMVPSLRRHGAPKPAGAAADDPS